MGSAPDSASKKDGSQSPLVTIGIFMGERGGGINSLLGCFLPILLSGLLVDAFIRVSLSESFFFTAE